MESGCQMTISRSKLYYPRRDDPDIFNPLGTIQRWSEEVKILHGKNAAERIEKITDHVILRLLPAAVQAEKTAKEAEEQELVSRQRQNQRQMPK